MRGFGVLGLGCTPLDSKARAALFAMGVLTPLGPRSKVPCRTGDVVEIDDVAMVMKIDLEAAKEARRTKPRRPQTTSKHPGS